MQWGDVWLVTLPFGAGREQRGQRPAVVIQNDQAGLASPLVLTVLFTTQMAATRFPGAVTVAPDGRNGLAAASVAMVFQTRALDRSRFVRRIGVLSRADMARILSDLHKLTSPPTADGAMG